MCSVFTNRKLKYHSAEDTIRSVLLQKPCVAFANSLLNVSLVCAVVHSLLWCQVPIKGWLTLLRKLRLKRAMMKR
jgi:hypothetical protein